jgi:glycosyltransferase involved in cell wall biosynthesis
MQDSGKLNKILIINEYFYPAFKGGGTITSLKNIYNLFEPESNIFIVLSSDKDLNNSHLEKTELLPNVRYTQNSKVIFELRRLPWNEIKIVYFNGLFSTFFFLIPLIYCRLFQREVMIIIAPRGSLQNGALQKSQKKKLAYLFITKKANLFNKVTWQATDHQEILDIRKFFPNALIKNVPNVTKAPSNRLSKIAFDRPLKLVFFSVIAEKKNLHLILEALNLITFPIIFDIYGPVKDKIYWSRCLKLIASLPINIKCIYHGAVNVEKFQSPFHQSHAFIMPTSGENFGHAIFQALAAGMPLIISKNTPWKDIVDLQVGWFVELESQDIKKAIEQLSFLNQNEFDNYRKNAYNLSLKYYESNDFKSQYQNLFHLK